MLLMDAAVFFSFVVISAMKYSPFTKWTSSMNLLVSFSLNFLVICSILLNLHFSFSSQNMPAVNERSDAVSLRQKIIRRCRVELGRPIPATIVQRWH